MQVQTGLGLPGSPGSPGRDALGRKRLGAAASSIVGNTPRDRPQSRGGSLAGAGGSMSSRSGNSGALSARKASTGSGSIGASGGQMALVRAMGKSGTFDASAAAGHGTQRHSAVSGCSPSPSDGDNHSDVDRESVCSNMSNISTRSTNVGSGGGGSGSRTSSRTVHVSVSDCSIDIDQQGSQDPMKATLCTDFRQLVGTGGHAEGLLQCLGMYGYQSPNKLQQHAIPMILHFLGKQLNGQTGHAGKGKSCMVIQGPPKSGKTSSAILALLSGLDFSLPQPQAILLSSSSKQDIDKYLRVFTLMETVNYQAFHLEGQLDEPLDEKSKEVIAARTAHILVGHPRRLLMLLNTDTSICLDAVKVVLIDDSEELLHAKPQAAPVETPPGTTEELRLIGLPSGEKSWPLSAESVGNAQETTKPPSAAETSQRLTSPIEDVVQCCNILEMRQYSQNMSDTYGIRVGQEQGSKIRHIILSECLADPASKKVMRLLKSSLMKKKNLLGVENCPPPTKMIRGMKHYYAAAPRKEWVRVFAGLVQSLMFPRALIFCDEDRIGEYYKEMLDMGIAVSANLPSPGGGGITETRRRAVQDFTSNRSQFLLTHSEPSVCQVMLPKVSCVFHFGLPTHMPSVYGVRLLPLDQKLVKDSASILLVEPRAGDKPGNTPPAVSSLSKLFGVNFMDMPWEFLPASKPSGRDRR